MNIDLTQLSNEQLATCVDLYVQRAMRLAELAEVDKAISIQIYANQYGSTGEYEISHSASIGDYNTTNKVTNNNAINGMRKCVDRWGADRIEQPTKIQPLLSAPVVSEDIEDAEFVPY